jgi:hypothetical protein
MGLLSFLMPAASPVVSSPRLSLPSNVNGRVAALYQLSLTKHTLYQSTGEGYVIKAPMFNPAYSGPRRLDLDVVGANVQFSPRRGFSLTGKVLGPIDASESAVYTFLISRGERSSSPGSLNSSVSFGDNAMVKVTTGPDGIRGSISLLDVQRRPLTTVGLPADTVHITGSIINLTLPASLIPSTSLPRAHSGISQDFYTFTAGIPGTKPNDIAGIVPEHGLAVVGVSGSRNH